MNNYKISDVVVVTVVGIANYGIFVALKGGYKGFIHISEISDKFVSNINYFVKLNEKIYAEIIGVDIVKERFNLSIKNISYKISTNKNNVRIRETPNGFKTLRRKLPLWIKENLKKQKN